VECSVATNLVKAGVFHEDSAVDLEMNDEHKIGHAMCRSAIGLYGAANCEMIQQISSSIGKLYVRYDGDSLTSFHRAQAGDAVLMLPDAYCAGNSDRWHHRGAESAGSDGSVTMSMPVYELIDSEDPKSRWTLAQRWARLGWSCSLPPPGAAAAGGGGRRRRAAAPRPPRRRAAGPAAAAAAGLSADVESKENVV